MQRWKNKFSREDIDYWESWWRIVLQTNPLSDAAAGEVSRPTLKFSSLNPSQKEMDPRLFQRHESDVNQNYLSFTL